MGLVSSRKSTNFVMSWLMMVTKLHPFILFLHGVQKFITRLYWVGVLLVYTVQCRNIKACVIHAPASTLDDDNLGDLGGRKRLDMIITSLKYFHESISWTYE